MLESLQKVIDKIEALQESNAKMQFALRHLMGLNENVSIGDIAVHKNGFTSEGKKKKKKNMKEAVIKTDSGEVETKKEFGGKTTVSGSASTKDKAMVAKTLDKEEE